MTRNHTPEQMSTFTLSISKERMDSFFKATGWSSSVRPESHPTIATCFRQGEFAAMQKLGVPLESVLHGDQEYRYLSDLRPDESYTGTTFLNQHFEKSGKAGVMKFYIFQTDLVNSSGEKCMECVATIICRIPHEAAKS